MLIRFWGTRGSLPMPMGADAVREKTIAALVKAGGRSFADADAAAGFVDAELDFPLRATYGGDSSCIEIESGTDEFIVCDMGSGVRRFGIDSLKRTAAGHAKIYNFFMSHFHWDHIMGFPFFAPAFDPTATIRIFGGHDDLDVALRRQQEKISFPVPFDALAAKFEFRTLTPGETYDIAGCEVQLLRQYHDNDSYGYRFERDGCAAVYSTDSEHKDDNPAGALAFVEFFRDAELVIFDTMYSLAETMTMKEDWGHSSSVAAVDLCHRAGVRRLAMFHHEPANDDETIYRLHQETIAYEETVRQDRRLEVLCSYERMEITL